MAQTTKIKLRINKESRDLMDAAKKDGSIKKLTVKIEATHSGIINHNKWFYTPAGMKDGAGTFVSPYGKPVLTNHDVYSAPLGRVLASEYEAYPEDGKSGLDDSLDSVSYSDKIKEFTKSDMFLNDEYKGLGHIMLTVEVTDADAIAKLLDGRYLTVSISGDTEQAVCSICNKDRKNIQDEEDACEHWRGDVYDGETAFLIAGAMTFKEVSFVNTPADENAKVNSISDSMALTDNISFQELEVLDFVIDKTGDTQLKRKLLELLEDAGLQGMLNDALKELGLDDNLSTEEELAALRKTSFLFSDKRAFPLHDARAIVAAYKVLETVEDSKDKTDAMTVLDKKYKKAFGVVTLLDAIAGLQESDQENTDNVEDQAPFVLDYDMLSDKVVDKLKGTFDLDDSFLSKRNESLEDELTLLEAENATLMDSLRSTIVLQILQKEDKVSDEGYRAKLETRTLDSLQDKLLDLTSDDSDESNDDTSDNSSDDSDVSDSSDDITDPNADISDAVDGDGNVADEDNGNEDDSDLSDDVDTLPIETIRDEYRKLIRTEGMRAASAYLADLRESKKVPANFAFLR